MNHPLRNINANARTRSSDKDNGEKNLWSSMLDSVSSGKKLPEKNLIVLGPLAKELSMAMAER